MSKGDTVKVGFLTLLVTEKTASGWQLQGVKDKAAIYHFEPHHGLFRVA